MKQTDAATDLIEPRFRFAHLTANYAKRAANCSLNGRISNENCDVDRQDLTAFVAKSACHALIRSFESYPVQFSNGKSGELLAVPGSVVASVAQKRALLLNLDWRLRPTVAVTLGSQPEQECQHHEDNDSLLFRSQDESMLQLRPSPTIRKFHWLTRGRTRTE